MSQNSKAMFKLIDLPYAPDALEPVISARTLEFHHGKHLQAYVDNLNKLIAGTEFEGLSLEEIVCQSSSLPAPTGNLAAQINAQWGSFSAFKSAFESAGTTLFGSGWVWLSAAPDGTLVITQEPGANNPITRVMPGLTGHLKPLLTFDVWEHAYYLDYQNRRAAHLKELWRIVDWGVVERRYL